VVSQRVLTFGETMGLVVTPRGESLREAATARLRTAGAESTVAIGLRRLGVTVSWAGVVGADGVGERVLRDLRGEGVDVSTVRVEPSAPTGLMLRELRPTSTRVTYYRDGSAGSTISARDVDAAFDAFGPDLVHVTGITAALSGSAESAVRRAVERAHQEGVVVSLDVNHRPSLPGSARGAAVVASLLPLVDLLFVGDDELSALDAHLDGERDPEKAARLLADAGATEVVLKQGDSGALAHVAGSTHRVGAERVPVVDVIGAGDSFVAGYLAALLASADVAERLRWGTVAAACTVASPGDWEGLPSRDELARYRGGGHRTER
jgi:2-dehydro-3-deoxygluconokinase